MNRVVGRELSFTEDFVVIPTDLDPIICGVGYDSR